MRLAKPSAIAVFFLHQQGITRLDVVNFISHGVAKIPEGAAKPESAEADVEVDAAPNGALENFTLNLNLQVLAGKIDPLIGRGPEIERVIQTLCRRRKNNPLLVGEAGVGKTAIAEGLARRIVEKDIPEVFLAHLETLLQVNTYLFASTPSFADIAIFPFIRQFAMVDSEWFEHCNYSKLRAWLHDWVGSSLFKSIMTKNPTFVG